MKKIISFIFFIAVVLTITACDQKLVPSSSESSQVSSNESSYENSTQTSSSENSTQTSSSESSIQTSSSESSTQTSSSESSTSSTDIKDFPTMLEYYDKMIGHFDSTFKTTLNGILKSTHTKKGSYSQAWNILQDSDELDNNNIRCFYTGVAIKKSNRVGNSSASIQWNREHVWAKSHGFPGSSQTAYSDCHHLRACEEKINGYRGNKPFDDVVSGSSDAYGNKWDSSAFEPRDEVKGDVARIMFYMVVRYDDSSLDLELEDKRTSTGSSAPVLGKLSTLVRWHYEDPVDEIEIFRNNVVYSYQGNRNPFIDNPWFSYYLYTEQSNKLGINLNNLMNIIENGLV